jgi:hypothetical protein
MLQRDSECYEQAEVTHCAGANCKKTPWPESASDRRFSAKLVPTFADRRCHVVSVTDPIRPYSRFP